MRASILLGLVVVGCFCTGLLVRVWLQPGGPPVAVIPDNVDLGERELGELTVTRFEIGNQGESPLEITGIRASCACAGIERETDLGPQRVTRVTVPPRSTVELLARITIRGYAGRPERTRVSFQTNDPNSRPQHSGSNPRKSWASPVTPARYCSATPRSEKARPGLLKCETSGPVCRKSSRSRRIRPHWSAPAFYRGSRRQPHRLAAGRSWAVSR